MNVSVNTVDNISTFTIEGRIDTLTAPELDKAFTEAEPVSDKVIFDMSGVDYISSAGMRVIIAVHRPMTKKNGLVLKGLSKNVRTIINLTGFTKVLNIEE